MWLVFFWIKKNIILIVKCKVCFSFEHCTFNNFSKGFCNKHTYWILSYTMQKKGKGKVMCGIISEKNKHSFSVRRMKKENKSKTIYEGLPWILSYSLDIRDPVCFCFNCSPIRFKLQSIYWILNYIQFYFLTLSYICKGFIKE